MAEHSKEDGAGQVQRLFQVLEAYGADPARWPESERDGLRNLLASEDPAIAQAVNAARELDAILAASPAPDFDADASRQRFLAGLGRKLPPASPPIDFDSHRVGRNIRTGRRLPWPALGALAASLAAGLYVGAGGMAREFVPSLLAGEVSEEELWSPAIFGDTAALVEDDE